MGGEGAKSSAEAHIAAVARRQRGLVTAAQLREAGLSKPAIARRVAAGRLHRVHAAVYAVGYVPRAPLAREAAALLAAGSETMLGHRSAAVGSGLLPPNASLPVDVIVPRGRSLRHEGIRCHRPKHPPQPHEIVVRDGLRMTSAARTILDLAATASPTELAKAVDEAYARGLIRPGELQPRAGERGAAKLRKVLEGRGVTRSQLERRFLALVQRAGLPKPETNVVVAGYRVDAVWREERVVVEIDTLGTHATRVLQDRERDAKLRAAGFEPLRFTDVQLDGAPEAVAAGLSRALVRR
ncbi:MAG TPA: type IV toxin-antitoxin system AbiEi family antitoxin domain-containing protein [Solirubrobacteraceae bacterium]|nr:type IV toxin-antitoxin system AbiEi family antitoxin domain-containing protein [Solirubrobacteraceae bacterium]